MGGHRFGRAMADLITLRERLHARWLSLDTHNKRDLFVLLLSLSLSTTLLMSQMDTHSLTGATRPNACGNTCNLCCCCCSIPLSNIFSLPRAGVISARASTRQNAKIKSSSVPRVSMAHPNSFFLSLPILSRREMKLGNLLKWKNGRLNHLYTPTVQRPMAFVI